MGKAWWSLPVSSTALVHAVPLASLHRVLGSFHAVADCCGSTLRTAGDMFAHKDAEVASKNVQPIAITTPACSKGARKPATGVACRTCQRCLHGGTSLHRNQQYAHWVGCACGYSRCYVDTWKQRQQRQSQGRSSGSNGAGDQCRMANAMRHGRQPARCGAAVEGPSELARAASTAQRQQSAPRSNMHGTRASPGRHATSHMRPQLEGHQKAPSEGAKPAKAARAARLACGSSGTR